MMTERSQTSTQILGADLFLLHAPSVFDFRERDDVLLACLSASDSVNVTSIYEMFPIGFVSNEQRLHEYGFSTELVNIALLVTTCLGKRQRQLRLALHGV